MKRIGFLLFPGFQVLDATGPVAAFEIAARLSGSSYDLSFLSAEGGLVPSSSGVTVATLPTHHAGTLDTLIAVGGLGVRQTKDCPDILAFISEQSRSARRTCSVCTGAFLLAAAGLLDGKRATTHWRMADTLASNFPLVKVDADAIYVREGAVWTSAGVTAGIDLALALIAEDLGEAVAHRTAQQMVVYYRRPGGQSQFSALLELGGKEGRFSELLGWMRAHIHERLTVEVLADKAAISPRHFTRAFSSAIGMTPARAVERLRLEAARERIEHSSEPIEYIAVAVGFADPERMRRAFLRAFGQPPQALRRAFRASRAS